jgi:CBS domain-containing protein
MRVEDVMTAEVVTARPDMTLKEAAREMAAHGISGLPVLDDELHVVGVVSEADLIAKQAQHPESNGHLLHRLAHREPSDEQRRYDAHVVSAAMTAPAVTVDAYYTLTGAAELMLKRGVNRLPVMRGERLVGIVTRADLVRAFARSDADVVADVREVVALQKELGSEYGPVGISIEEGQVTLTGQVRRRAVAETLPWAARGVPGVVDVRSELTWSVDE